MFYTEYPFKTFKIMCDIISKHQNPFDNGDIIETTITGNTVTQVYKEAILCPCCGMLQGYKVRVVRKMSLEAYLEHQRKITEEFHSMEVD